MENENKEIYNMVLFFLLMEC